MTNTNLLREKIRQSGLKYGYIAEQMALTRQGLYNKINGKNEFTAKQIVNLCEILGIEDKDEFFFAKNVINNHVTDRI